MRFGLFFQAPERAGESHAQRFAEMLELAALADSLGFDVAWLAEIHFGGAFSLLSNPLMAVPAIAQRTKRIRIGTAVTLLPLHHPLACAEQAATADILSGGRLEFGVGRGSIPTQFHGFRVPVVGEPRALRRVPRHHPPGLDEGALQLRRHVLPDREPLGGAQAAPAPASADPGGRAHPGELRPHRELGVPIYSGTTTTPAAAAPRVHGDRTASSSRRPAIRGAPSRWR